MPFCNACKRLEIHLLSNSVQCSEQGIHHSTTGVLLSSAQNCNFCSLINESFLRVDHYHTPKAIVEETLRSDPSTPIFLRAGRKKEDDSMDRVDNGARLSFIEVLVGCSKNIMKGRIHLYASKCKFPTHITRLLLIRQGVLLFCLEISLRSQCWLMTRENQVN
jgi:hypothetical protein